MTVIEAPAAPPQLAALYAGCETFPSHIRTHKPWEPAGPDQDLALATAVGIRVIRAAGAEFEDGSYLGLNQLLLALRDDLSRLDRPQRNALNAALALGFIARRLQGSRVEMIAAERTGASRLPALGIARYEMRPIDVNQARRLGTAAYLAASSTGDLNAA